MCAGHVSSERAGIADDLFTGLFIYVAARKKEQHWQAILKHWQAIVKNKTHIGRQLLRPTSPHNGLFI